MTMPTIVVGDIVWRRVEEERSGKIVVRSPEFVWKDGSYLIKATHKSVDSACSLGEARVKSETQWLADGSSSYGLVCFCEQEIPASWIGFVVIRVGERVAWVEPITGEIADLLSRAYAWRVRGLNA